ncbi:MAG: type 4 fimbrial biogenesis protein PilE [uncultured bacterium]|nr:MAG: type 4 fimbrial biogenesis protein PilE [uncultured bacterium]
MKNGFTLIELLIVIALIGILGSIAYPLYGEHLTRVRRTYAATAIVDLAGRMEEYYVSKNTYNDATIENLRVNNARYKNYYRLDITAKDDAYVLHATPLGKQADSDILCGTLTIDQNGNRTISGSGAIEECWH